MEISSSLSPLVEARQIVRYGEYQELLLPKTSCAIYAGDRIVLNGASGTGKSVLMRTLALLDIPNEGHIYFKSQSVQPKKMSAYRSQVAYLRQHAILSKGTVRDNLKFPFGLKIYQHAQYQAEVIDKYLDLMGKPQNFLDKDCRNLSGGETQIVCLMRVLQLNPQVLLLDEPTSALDTQSAQLIEKLIDHALSEGEFLAYLWISHDDLQIQRMGQKIWQMSSGGVLEEGVQ